MAPSNKSGKGIALLFALGASVLLLCVLTDWDEFVIRYYVSRLETDPGFFDSLVKEPDTSVGHKALQRYVVTPDGKDRLLSTYLSALRKQQPVERYLTALAEDPTVTNACVWVKDSEMHFCWYEVRTGRIYSIQRTFRAPFEWAALQSLLVHADYRGFSLRSSPGFTFDVLSDAEARKRGKPFLDTDHFLSVSPVVADPPPPNRN